MESLEEKIENEHFTILKLANGMTIYYKHDPDSPLAFAMVDFETGSVNDEIPGLSHFLEHVVINGGTEKFSPKEIEEFQKSFQNHQLKVVSNKARGQFSNKRLDLRHLNGF